MGRGVAAGVSHGDKKRKLRAQLPASRMKQRKQTGELEALTCKVCLWWWLPPTRPHLLNLSKQCHWLGTKCSNIWTHGNITIQTATGTSYRFPGLYSKNTTRHSQAWESLEKAFSLAGGGKLQPCHRILNILCVCFQGVSWDIWGLLVHETRS